MTTQFISNVERGVTPLPPSHIATLTQALLISEEEIRSLLEQEYTAKLSQRLGKSQAPLAADSPIEPHTPLQSVRNIRVQPEDFEFIQSLYDSYRKADPSTRLAFRSVCESMLKIPATRKAQEPQ